MNTKFYAEQSSDECYVVKNMIPDVNTHPMTFLVEPETQNLKPETCSLCQS